MGSFKIAVTGSTGLVGSEVVSHFRAKGHAVVPIVRSPDQVRSVQDSVYVDFNASKVDLSFLEGFDLLVHLAGANISDKRWTRDYKKIILDSRVITTQRLVEGILRLKTAPKAVFCASAIGFYGFSAPLRGVDESACVGSDFLADVCRQWESATSLLNQGNVRVVNMRFGVILSKNGGALKKMLPIFKAGLGGRLGAGAQMMSWVHLGEIPLAIEYMIKNPQLSGPVNIVSPNTVTNAEFTMILGKVLKRPVVFPVPAAAVRLGFGEMGESLLLNGVRVLPKKLLGSNYQFQYPDLEHSLTGILK